MANEITRELRIARQYDAVSRGIPASIHRRSVPQWDYVDTRDTVPTYVCKTAGRTGTFFRQLPPLLIRSGWHEVLGTGWKRRTSQITRLEQG